MSNKASLLLSDFRRWIKDSGINIKFREEEFRMVVLMQLWGEYVREQAQEAYLEAQKAQEEAETTEEDESVGEADRS